MKSTKTTIPFVKNNNMDYADLVSFCGKYKTQAGWILFVLVTIFVITAVSNGANLNDGMDGMAAGNSAIICIALGILAYVSSHIEMAAYLNIMYVPGSQELVIFCCAMVGALIGFLWYNAYPAQIFMGDTGSLAIGGIIAVLAIIGTERHESRRVDRQLRGRAGRQGDPGSSVFYVSLEDLAVELRHIGELSRLDNGVHQLFFFIVAQLSLVRMFF